ncbi:clustered mitochondria protein homolog, partial [Striga asiatica]
SSEPPFLQHTASTTLNRLLGYWRVSLQAVCLSRYGVSPFPVGCRGWQGTVIGSLFRFIEEIAAEEDSKLRDFLDTFQGRVYECPIVNGVHFKGDGYSSCVDTVMLYCLPLFFYKIIRHRALYRMTSDFVEAETSGAIGLISKCILPINPTDPECFHVEQSNPSSGVQMELIQMEILRYNLSHTLSHNLIEVGFATQIMGTQAEIQERHDAVRHLENKLLDLQQFRLPWTMCSGATRFFTRQKVCRKT